MRRRVVLAALPAVSVPLVVPEQARAEGIISALSVSPSMVRNGCRRRGR